MNVFSRIWLLLQGTPKSEPARRPRLRFASNRRGQDEFGPTVFTDLDPQPCFRSTFGEQLERERFSSGGAGVYDGAGASARFASEWTALAPAAAPHCTPSENYSSSTSSSVDSPSDSGACSSSSSSGSD